MVATVYVGRKNLCFLLMTLNVIYVLTTSKPREHEDETLAETRVQWKWEQDDTLFDQYHNKPTAKEI